MNNQFAGMPVEETTTYEELSTSFPRVKYHGDGRNRTVHYPEQETALGDGWYDSPADIPEHELVKPETEAAPAAGGACSSCEALTKALTEQQDKFSGAWGEITQRNREISRDLADANAKIADLEARLHDASADRAEEDVPAEAAETNVAGPAATTAGAEATDATAPAATTEAPKTPRRKRQ